MDLGFQVDVFNNTSRQVTISSGSAADMNAGGLPTTTLNGGQWMSNLNNNQPYYVEAGGETGAITIIAQAAGVEGSFRLEFDAHALTNFNGVPLFGSAGDLVPVTIEQNGQITYIFASLYLAVFGQWTQAIVMLVEAVGASANIARPY